MNTVPAMFHMCRKWQPIGACMLIVCALLGCDSPAAKFRANTVYIGKELGSEVRAEVKIGKEDTSKEIREKREAAKKTQAGREQQLATVHDAMTAMFGTPDKPYIVADAELGVTEVVDPALLPIAAGSVGRDENGVARGLYRQHCVHCHGVTGDGQGPTAAFLNPYPRDFRMGLFKFKSTPSTQPPTREDLRKTLYEGIPGTAMPSFKALLADDEIAAVINYVRYLAVRGEVERKLIYELTFIGPEEPLETTKDFLVDQTLGDVVGRWVQAESAATAIPPAPTWTDDERKDAIDRGKLLFQGKLANCFSCHGVTALGDGQTGDYDEWTKDLGDFSKEPDPIKRHKMMEDYVEWGGLPPRNILPRNLRQGVYRGGRRPIDLYWRIRNGIAGTPMPASGVSNMTDDQVWDLIAYVQHLPYESISQPPKKVVENLRENP